MEGIEKQLQGKVYMESSDWAKWQVEQVDKRGKQ